MGAWIEIKDTYKSLTNPLMSHPTMGAWIEISPSADALIKSGSHPTMGAWIEIKNLKHLYHITRVAPHDGCVD